MAGLRFGTFRKTTKSIDARLESLDGELPLNERLGGSTVNKSSFLRWFVRGFVRNTGAKE